ncbi:ABC transporter substrate-binding protein [Isoptericola sp. NPDC057391]|uniref:ABC transporter substrate-binding protein n=1 Tax=Isoptericola sp. NPDC057391 TaxID=3346117 RepID=UPI003629C348
MRRGLRRAVAATAAGLAGLSLAACAPGDDAGSANNTSCTNEIPKPDATRVTLWAWYPAVEQIVDTFNAQHDDIQICWTNAGQGADEYGKFSTALEAGTGAPDVIQLESEILPTYTILDGLADLAPYGAGDLEDQFPAGAWSDVSSGDSVFAVPVDGGPVGMLYRADIFAKYGVEPPTTWDEFAQAAQDLRDAGYDGYITNYATNGGAFNYALFAQAGWAPFAYNPAQRDQIGIDVDTPESRKVLSYWEDLIDRGLVSSDDAFTSDYNTSLVDGTYAVYIAAAWGPGYLEGLSDADSGAEWKAAPLPQWDPANPVQVNQGGSALAVTSQASDPEAAATVAMELFDDEETWKIGVEDAGLFPLWNLALDAPWFTDRRYPFFGGQQVNRDVFLDAAAQYPGFTFSPFQVYAYDRQTMALYDMVEGDSTAADALATIQDSLVRYAEQQGFTVR